MNTQRENLIEGLRNYNVPEFIRENIISLWDNYNDDPINPSYCIRYTGIDNVSVPNMECDQYVVEIWDNVSYQDGTISNDEYVRDSYYFYERSNCNGKL